MFDEDLQNPKFLTRKQPGKCQILLHAANNEGITALHDAIIVGHIDIM